MIRKVWQQIDSSENTEKVFGWFLVIWLIVNLLQSFFTELAHDEAYYWMYSRDLDWGYFDHPPMIAILVKLGYAIFPNELGVRLFPSILGTATIYIIYLILKEELKSISLLIVLLLSIILVQTHVGGFLAIPDIPLVFFAALFYFLYKRYLKEDSWKLAVFLGIVSAGMLYSKYHAVLVMFFTLVSNLHVLKRKTFWLIPAIVVVAMLPHLMWQINNDFPTFGYHLVGRSSAYRVDRTLNYILGQLLIAGPLVSLIVFYHSVKAKTNGDAFLRAMKFNFYGFFLFFFFSSFKGHVEPHWTAIALIPLIVLSYRSIITAEKAKLWLARLFIPTMLFVLLGRGALLFDIVPKKIYFGHEFHNWDQWAKDIKELAGERKVVFANSFQYPSKYAFYSGGEFAHGLNSIHYRKNQYDLWGYEKMLQSEDVILFRGYGLDTLKTKAGNIPYRKINNFRSYYDIEIQFEGHRFAVEKGEVFSLKGKIVNSREDTLIFESSDSLVFPRLCVSWHNGKGFSEYERLQYISDTIPPGESIPIEVKLKMPDEEGDYSCYVSIVNDILWEPFNTRNLEFELY